MTTDLSRRVIASVDAYVSEEGDVPLPQVLCALAEALRRVAVWAATQTGGPLSDARQYALGAVLERFMLDLPPLTDAEIRSLARHCRGVSEVPPEAAAHIDGEFFREAHEA